MNEGNLALIRPVVDTQKAIGLACSLYGLSISDPTLVKEFVSYDDRNFYMKGTLPDHENELQTSECEFVLKILNHVDSGNISFVNAQNEVMLYLKKQGFTCQVPLRALNNEFAAICCLTSDAASEGNHKARVNALRLLSFVPGKLFKDVPCTPGLLFNLGCYVAKMNKALQGFHHSGFDDSFKHEWDLSQIHTIKSYIMIATHDDTEQKLLTHVYNNFVNEVIPKLGNLKKQIIHGDINDENIIVAPNQCGDGHEIVSIIDFGDMSVSYRVFEVAICMMYVITLRVQQGDAHNEAIRMAGHMLHGYQSIHGLSQSGLGLLYWSVAARFFQSIVIGKYKQSLEPENVYLSNTCDLALDILSTYISMPGEESLNSWLSIMSEKTR